MRLRTSLHVFIFSMAFIVPQIIFFFLETYVWSEKTEGLFRLPIHSDRDSEFFRMLGESMDPALNISTLQIIGVNVMVSLMLWGAVISMYLIFYRRKEMQTVETKKLTFTLAYFACLFFFLKEGVRVGMSVVDFYYSVRIPYLPATLTLILPHAIFEFMAFILVAIFALNWLKGSLEVETFAWPRPLIVIFPLILVVASALVETTMTPHLFQTYIEYALSMGLEAK